MSQQPPAGTVLIPNRRSTLSGRRAALMMSAAVLALTNASPLMAQDANALPTGGAVVGGSATIGTPTPQATLQITQTSDRALINWDSFDIGSDAQVNFAQPGASAITLNRVVGGSAPSQIAGKLTANGTVAVINSNGVMFAGTADINVGGLIASAVDISDADFMDRATLSFGSSTDATGEIVVSAGAGISIADQGLALFFAPTVRNEGMITARLGHVTLASGSSATIDLDGTGFLEIGLGSENALVENGGSITASGGTIRMTAKAASATIDQIINTGTLSVAGVSVDPGGIITLSADKNVRLGGTIDAGTIGSANFVAGNEIEVASNVSANGNIALTARHILGAGDVNVATGALSLALDIGGADTSSEGNFVGDALGVIGTGAGGATLDLGAGIYAAGGTISRGNVTVDGGGVATIRVPINGSAINGLNVNANDATVTGLTFTSTLPEDTAAWDYGWGSSITRGIAVGNGVNNATITGNTIRGVRNGVLVDGRGATTLSITGNVIDNTKSAISVQYVDASAPGWTISGNDDGAFGNEWGIILHLNGVWNGTTTTSGAGLLGDNPSLDEQARLLALSNANGGISVYNQGYTASNRTQVFVDPNGGVNAQGAAPTPIDTIQGGIDAVVTGGTVNVGAGLFAETVSITKGLTLRGAGMDTTAITGGILLSGVLSDLALSDFTVRGSGGTSVISGGQVTNLTVDAVRIDAEGVVGRHGFSGGRYGGDISITNSEFLNIRGWSAFDTRSGAGAATDGTQIASAVFSNNLLDNTIGHIAFRQQAGAGTYPVVTMADNIVRNAGNSDESFGAIFKAFRAARVDFSGNSVSDVGISSWTPAGEATYGAVLMTRDVGTLNVTGNTFTDNHQVFAVEPGYGLPGVVNFTDNSFFNNGYSIYLPGNLASSGTISFAGTNNFVAGPDTAQHIVWRSVSGLDLTGVSFDGTRASELSLNDLFAVEDLITHGVDVSGAGLARVVAGQLYITPGAGTDSMLRGVALAAVGDTLNISAGTHQLTNTLLLQNNIAVIGQGQGETIIDASGHGSYGIRVKSSNTTLSGFTLYGSSVPTGNSNYGIKVESGGDASARNLGFSISDVTISGSRKTGLDINSAVGVLIDGVTVMGVTAGNGIAITDSADVTVRNSHTSGNAWGGLALYQSNNLAGGGSNQRLTGIMIEANNGFGEANGLYLQDSSALFDPGTLNIQGYGFTVRNAEHRPDGAQFTYFQKTRQAAFDYGVNLDAPGASIVQGWTGSANDANFYVGQGALNGGGNAALSIQAAIGASSDGAAIHVASGTYAEQVSLAGARALDFGDVTLEGVAISGSGSSLVGNLNLASAGFTAKAAVVLSGDTSIRSLGGISIAGLTGNAALTLAGETVSLGQSSLSRLDVTAARIRTAGVVTTDAQHYTGATSLGGSYTAREFLLDGAATLTDSTTVAVSGTARFGTVNGTVAGGQNFTLNAGSATLGSLGNEVRLGATAVTAKQTVLSGARYAANRLSFMGRDADATVRLTQSFTRFDASLVDGDVSIGAHLIGTASGQQSVEITAGAGLAGAANEGNISLGNVGSDVLRLGGLSVTGGNFSAATVKLAGNFNSKLSGNQVFTSNTLDTLGDVSASVAGNESGPIRAGGSVAVAAGGSGTGSIIAGGPVQLSYTTDVEREISSQGSVSVVSDGAISGSINAAGPVEVNAAGPVSSSVTTGGAAKIKSAAGVSGNVTAGGSVSVTASKGDISGSINAAGPVDVSTDEGSVSSAISTTGDASVKSGSGSISSTINAGGSVAVSAPGAVTSTISSGGSISVTSDTPIDVQVNGGAVRVNAPGGKVGGVFNEIATDDGGSFVVNDQPVVGSGKINPRQIIVDSFLRPVGGTIGASGEIVLPSNFALGLIAPAGQGAAVRPPVVVNNVEDLGDLLRRGYTAIVIRIDESGVGIKHELASGEVR